MIINRTTSRIINNKLVTMSVNLNKIIDNFTNNLTSEQKYKDDLLALNSSLQSLHEQYKFLIESDTSLMREYNYLTSKIARYYYRSHRLSSVKSSSVSEEN